MKPSLPRYVDTTLQLIGNEGFSGLSIHARSLVEALNHLGIPRAVPPEIRSRIAHELRRQQLVELARDGYILKIQLSTKGFYRLQKSVIDRLVISPPKVWSNSWQVIFFDIPSRHSQSRYLLTAQLKRLGFYMIRNSTWVHPYECTAILEQIITYTNLQSFVSYGTITHFDPSTTRKLLRYFQLTP